MSDSDWIEETKKLKRLIDMGVASIVDDPTARIDDEPMSDAQREAVTKWSRARPMRDIRSATTFEWIAGTNGYYRAAADSGYTRDALLAMEVAPGQDIQSGDAVAMRVDGRVEPVTRNVSVSFNTTVARDDNGVEYITSATLTALSRVTFDGDIAIVTGLDMQGAEVTERVNGMLNAQTLVSYNSAAVDSVAEAYDLVRIPGESDESLRARIAFYAQDQYSPSILTATGDDLDRLARDAYGIERRGPRSLDPDNWLLRQNAPEVMEWDRERFSMREDALRAEILARNATFAAMGNPLPFDAPHGGLCAFRASMSVACADRTIRCRARKHRELTKCVATPCLLASF